MFGNLRIRRCLCVVFLLPLAAGPAIGADGPPLYGPAPSCCPACNTGSGPCPANVKYFGYYPTRWRRWPGTEPVPATAPPADQSQHVEVPPAKDEALGKPNATTGDTGTTTAPADTTTDPNSSSSPVTPKAAAPGTGVPMLNGLPLPNGTQLPNGGPTPNNLPAPNQPDPAAKGSQLFPPARMPVATTIHPISSEPVELGHDWPNLQPATAPFAAPATMAPPPAVTETREQVTPVSAPAPSYQWPPANMLRSSTIRAGFQAPAESSAATAPHPTSTAAWIEPLPPLDTLHAPAPAWVPANSLRVDMPPMQGQASVGSTVDRSLQARSEVAIKNPQEFDHSENHVSMRIIAEKPARAASLPADDSTLRPVYRPAPNTAASLAPMYQNPTTDHRIGAAFVNSPSAISPARRPTTAQVGPANEIRFSPLRDAVVNSYRPTDEGSNSSMSAIDPLQIGRAMADDQQPAMKSLPIQNALSTNQFQASDYVSQDRSTKPGAYASTNQPIRNSSTPSTRQLTDPAVQPISYEQHGAIAEPNLGSINPLEVAQSLNATPAAPAPLPARH